LRGTGGGATRAAATGAPATIVSALASGALAPPMSVDWSGAGVPLAGVRRRGTIGPGAGGGPAGAVMPMSVCAVRGLALAAGAFALGSADPVADGVVGRSDGTFATENTTSFGIADGSGIGGRALAGGDEGSCPADGGVFLASPLPL
jgi:hypothetical protein